MPGRCGGTVPVKSTTGSREQPAENFDLLLLTRPTTSELVTERLVLDVVPSHAHTQPQPTARQKVDVGRLPGHECRLALREHHHAGREANPLRDSGEIGEHHKRVVKRVKLRVRTRQRPLPIRMDGAKHMIVGKQMVKAQTFHRETDLPNSSRIPSKLGLRVNNADLHPWSMAGDLRDRALVRTADRMVEGHESRVRHSAIVDVRTNHDIAWRLERLVQDSDADGTRASRGWGRSYRPASWDGFYAGSAQGTEGFGMDTSRNPSQGSGRSSQPCRGRRGRHGLMTRRNGATVGANEKTSTPEARRDDSSRPPGHHPWREAATATSARVRSLRQR